MSASALRDTARLAIQKAVDEYVAALVASGGSIEEIRHKQGVVYGLKMADDLLSQAYKDLHQ